MAAIPNSSVALLPPSPPFLEVEGIANFRDLGGYPISAAPFKSIRTGLIYRCGEPSKVTETGIATLRGLGITHLYDLRSNVEIEKFNASGLGKIVELGEIQRVFVPVFTDEDYSPENLALRLRQYASEDTEAFTKVYDDILINAPPSYRTILRHLVNDEPTPLIIHCTAGKDRTGVLGALILSLCGVDDKIVAYEYALTDLGFPPEFKSRIIQHLMENPAFKDDEAGARNVMTTKAVNMLSTLRLLREKFGGPENYVIEKCGLTNEEVQKIRSSLIIDAEPLHKIPFESL